MHYLIKWSCEYFCYDGFSLTELASPIYYKLRLRCIQKVNGLKHNCSMHFQHEVF